MGVRTERKGDVLVVTIDRPDVRNAVDRPTAEDLERSFRAFDADAELAAAVLTGSEGTFCAGADLHAVAAAATGDGEAADRVNRLERGDHGPMGPSRLILDKPVIAAVEGYAVAGGLELALWCDLRVVAEDAVLGVFCRRWGVPLIDGGTVRLPRLIGLSHALDLILTGRPVHADEALAIGLANRVVPSGETLAAALDLAHQIASFPQATMRADRRSAYEGLDLPLGEALLHEHDGGVPTLADAQTVAGVQAFEGGAGRGGSFDRAHP
ncbi:MAG TPA: crotonase/enoyl-CoA hydratase family protein [Nitriliruptorales bacterium]